MKIYTKRGDSGQTDLFGGMRVSKACPRVLAYGAVDHANACIGYAAVLGEIPELQSILCDLFDLGAELATVPHKSDKSRFLSAQRIDVLEQWIDGLDGNLPILKNFILPTGSELAGRLHLARTAVRQAEQNVIALHDLEQSIRPEIIMYLNRLSDLLFVWARWANIKSGIKEVLWAKH